MTPAQAQQLTGGELVTRQGHVGVIVSKRFHHRSGETLCIQWLNGGASLLRNSAPEVLNDIEIISRQETQFTLKHQDA